MGIYLGNEGHLFALERTTERLFSDLRTAGGRVGLVCLCSLLLLNRSIAALKRPLRRAGGSDL